ncbi:MAG: tyrosine--tRNA ligase [Patescibacteria group bacterium]
MTNKEKIKEILQRGVEEIFVKEHLENSLLSGKVLRIKFGIDPTSPGLHLGHAVVLRKLKELQTLGHTIVLIIGDFTATIGDPSGKSKTRPRLSPKEVRANMKDYLRQASKIINIKKTEVRYNSSWLKKVNGAKIIELLGLVSVNQILERNDFANRLKEQKSIGAHELLYPVMQAYDSVIIRADLECGGTDQTFNLLMGRTLMERLGHKPQDVLTTPIIEGTDGKEKMSKSLGNYIGITDAPEEMFGKVMSIKDELIGKYFLLCTDLPEEEIKKIEEKMNTGEMNPKDAKIKLASRIVSIYHGEKEAQKAKEEFAVVFEKGKMPANAPELFVKGGTSTTAAIMMSGLVSSKTELSRLYAAGALLDTETNEIISGEMEIKKDLSLRIGKKRFLKIKTKIKTK